MSRIAQHRARARIRCTPRSEQIGFRGVNRRRFSQQAKQSDKEGGLSTKLIVAGGVLAIALPSYTIVSSLQSNPEMREQVQLNYPEFYAAVDGIVPGGLEVVTYASIRASQSDWLDTHELPWGEGYNENIPNVIATIITKRGSRYTGVELSPTDCGKSILEKIIPLGAQIDDEVIDVRFEDAADSSFSQLDVAAMTGLTDNMSQDQLKETIDFLRKAKVECEVQEATWRGKGTVGQIKAQEMAKKASVFEAEIDRIKSLLN